MGRRLRSHYKIAAAFVGNPGEEGVQGEYGFFDQIDQTLDFSPPEFAGPGFDRIVTNHSKQAFQFCEKGPGLVTLHFDLRRRLQYGPDENPMDAEGAFGVGNVYAIVDQGGKKEVKVILKGLKMLDAEWEHVRNAQKWRGPSGRCARFQKVSRRVVLRVKWRL